MKIEQAAAFLKGKVRRTPMEYSQTLSELLKVPVYLKLECLQLTGSFKIRGALYYLSTLTEAERKRGVAACSAGNHGMGVAYAAQQLGIPCTIFVPKSVDQTKFEKIAKLGANVVKSQFPGYDDTLEWAQREAAKQGLHFITAFDDERIMAGNGGSIAVEVLEDLPEAENFILPVGGGGISAGFAYYAKAKKPKCRMIGCQHIDSPALKLSLESGVAVTKLPAVETLAGGIEGGIGEKPFAILKSRINDVALLSEEEIVEGVRWVLKNHQYLIEPTAAVVIAACLFNQVENLKGPTVVILTGRNVNYDTIKKILR